MSLLVGNLYLILSSFTAKPILTDSRTIALKVTITFDVDGTSVRMQLDIFNKYRANMIYCSFLQNPLHDEVEQIAREGIVLSEISHGIKRSRAIFTYLYGAFDIVKTLFYTVLSILQKYRDIANCLIVDNLVRMDIFRWIHLQTKQSIEQFLLFAVTFKSRKMYTFNVKVKKLILVSCALES